MSDFVAYVSGIGVKGPGLADWPQARAVLCGHQPYVRTDPALSAPENLPPTERRRAGRVVRLALAAGLEATRHAKADPARLRVVFASSGGDGDNCHEICQTLASPNRALSPTRFHNSVHNAPAGYWSIGAGTQVTSTTICAYDASFGAGLIEALCQVATDADETALVAYDVDYPPPLLAARPTSAPLAVALVLRPGAGSDVVARVSARLGGAAPARMKHPDLEALRTTIPAAQGLLLLEAIALQNSSIVNIPYLGSDTLCIEVTPCG